MVRGASFFNYNVWSNTLLVLQESDKNCPEENVSDMQAFKASKFPYEIWLFDVLKHQNIVQLTLPLTIEFR